MRRVYLLGSVPVSSPFYAVTDRQQDSVRSERSHISLQVVFDFDPFLKSAQVLNGSVLFQVTHCAITDNLKHRLFEWFIYGLFYLDYYFRF